VHLYFDESGLVFPPTIDTYFEVGLTRPDSSLPDTVNGPKSDPFEVSWVENWVESRPQNLQTSK
jgi:hypothetical protein